MYQEAVRRLFNRFESFQVRKVASLLARPLRFRVGLTEPLHSTALGKVMLAYGKETEQLASLGLERRTANIITDTEELRAELEEIRWQGFAVDGVENEEDVRCVAAPVFDHKGEVVGSISVSGPKYRIPLDRVEELGIETREAALTVSRRIGYRYDIYNSKEVSREENLSRNKSFEATAERRSKHG